ncbi:MAG: histidine--tRNA ligase [Gammaproteobacteria bacterium]|nr:histidine--tRNA ligase [Gammaproteobacteria bacterium]MXX16554.1 histidine--tRNA ligase [Gammaproteobacteria bacterium]MYH91720.1 histidine--tRNA ligase [Gammaproteobacteria bacterium]
MSRIQAVKGMNDLLPGQIGHWHRVEAVLRDVAWRYGYQEIRTPVLEKTELFRQAIGDQTDIVEKEMYVFEDAGGVSLALRPEATASTVRAGNEHGLFHNRKQRLWYMGPMFRRERPQKGRYRQFHQFGIEAFGWPGPDVDAEVIRVGTRVWKELGVAGVKLHLNTLGSEASRTRYRDALRDYFTAHVDSLDGDSQRRLERNPLRILDSKVPETRQIVMQAPSMMDFLESGERENFDSLVDSLSRSGIEPVIDDRLVRGLDYYTGTVFEWVTDQLGSQDAVCAGGRYDGLVASRGGHPTPAVGFAMGLERLVELMSVQDIPADGGNLDVYVISMADQQTAVDIGEALRDAGYRVCEHCGGGKLSNSMKRADQSGARFAVVVGEEEQAEGSVQLKDLRGGRGQVRVPRESLVQTMREIG